MQIHACITSTVSASGNLLYMAVMAAASAPTPLYIQIAESVIERFENGTLRAGEKAPSLRRLSAQKRVSISTALQAYMWLESRGIWKRARSPDSLSGSHSRA